MFAYIQRVSTVKSLFFALLLGLIAGCSDDNPDPIGGISGTGVLLQGTVQNARAFASNDVQIKAQGNPVVQASINSQGEFSAADLPSDAPYLLRVDFTSGAPFYALTYVQNGRQNIHAYSDLVIRNWYASQGQDIDDVFERGLDMFLPTESQLIQTTNLISNLLASVLAEYNLSGVDLSTAEYLSDDQGVDEFLDSNPVVIIEGNVNIIVTNPNTNLQTPLTSNLPLVTDLSVEDVTPPSQPESLRALTTEDFEIVLAWEASKDNIGVSQYEILRDGVVIDTSTFPAFIDSTVETGEMYTYTVVAIDASGNQSVQSAPATAEIVVDVTSPPAPENVTLIPRTDSIRIDWDQDSIFDVSSFIIFSNSQEIASTTSTFAYQAGLPSGTQFCYEVIAVDGSGNRSLPSAEECTMTLSSDAIVTPAAEVVAPMLDEPVVSAPANATIIGAWGGIVMGPDGSLPVVLDFEDGSGASMNGSFNYPTRTCFGSLEFLGTVGETYELSQINQASFSDCRTDVRVSVRLNTIGAERTLEFTAFNPVTNDEEYTGTLQLRVIRPEAPIVNNWGGVVVSPEGNIQVLLDIAEGDAGSLVGSFNYPTRTCNGTFNFVANVNGAYEFFQDNLASFSDCRENVRVSLSVNTFGTEQTLNFRAFNPATNDEEYTGTLQMRAVSPDALIFGSWGGIVVSSEGDVQLRLDLEAGSDGSVEGSFDYPTRACSGSFNFVAKVDQSYEFFQDNEASFSDCRENVRVTLNLTSPIDEIGQSIDVTAYSPETNEINIVGTLGRRQF